MQKITNSAELRNATLQLESRRADEWMALRGQFLITCENLKPLNLIKNTCSEFVSTVGFKDELLGTAAGLTSGYLSRKLVTGFSGGPVKKILGTLLQLGVTNIVSRHPETVKRLAGNIAHLFKNENKHADNTLSNDQSEKA